MSDFERFMTGLAADSRLGRYVSCFTTGQTPETIILALVVALAGAYEGKQPHPVHELLARMQER